MPADAVCAADCQRPIRCPAANQMSRSQSDAPQPHRHRPPTLRRLIAPLIPSSPPLPHPLRCLIASLPHRL
eukprot:1177706-Prorocentrum_minimum.AAC.3